MSEALSVITLTLTDFQVNCYLVIRNAEILIIDPGGEADIIIDALREHNCTPRAVLLTHAHGDHIGAVERIRTEYSIPVALHADDIPLAENAELNLSAGIGKPVIITKPDIILYDRMEYDFGSLHIQTLHCPGHSPGGCAFVIGEKLFSGDILFAGSIGRTDFPYSDSPAFITAIKEKLMILPDTTAVYPGHGPATTIGDEKRNNPFLL